MAEKNDDKEVTKKVTKKTMDSKSSQKSVKKTVEKPVAKNNSKSTVQTAKKTNTKSESKITVKNVPETEVKNAQSVEKSDINTGSPEYQIRVLTNRINTLTKHLKTHKKDHHSRYGLMALVGKRRGFLDYLMEVNIDRYRSLISELKIRK
jgi:small subunit ribosomal protein S15